MTVSADVVQKSYLAFFGRPADAVGLNYWQTQDEATMNAGFAASTEYATMYSGMTNEARVSQVYWNLLGREADVPGLLYWAGEMAAGRETVASLVTSMQANALGIDIDTIANRVTYATAFTAALDTAAEIVAYTGTAAADAARAAVLPIVDTAASLTTAQDALTASVASTVAAGSSTAGQTYALASTADIIPGTSGNDTITGAIGTLTSSDEIHGGAGTDTLTVKIDNLTANNTAYAPIIDGVETITLEARNASATFFMTNVSGATTLNVKGITNFGLADLANSGTVNVTEGYSADLTLDLATNTATAQAITVNLNNASGTDIRFADDSGTTAADTLTLDAVTNWGHGSSATNFSGVEKLVLKGQGDINLNMASAVAGGLSADAFVDTTAIDASGMTGALTLRLDSVDVNLMGGAGADTFIMTANLNTNDTVDGGAGTDTLDTILTGGYIRPIISNVETLNFLVNSTAATADFRDVSGVNTLNLMLGTGLLVDKAQTSMSTINVNSSDSTANALTVQFGSAAIASDVTLNLGNGVEGTLQSAAATASGMGIGTITMSGNSGSLTIVTNSTAKYSAAAVALNDFTAVTLNAASANFVVDSAVNVNSAHTLSLNAAAGKTLTIGNDVSATAATNFSISAAQSATVTLAGTAQINGASSTVTLNAGASATIDLLGLSMSGTNTLTIGGGASSLVTADAIVLGQAGATAGSGALAMQDINITTDGDVTIAAIGSNTAVVHSAVSLSFNVAMTNTAASVGISALGLSDVAGGATASEQGVTFNLSGTGAFVLSAAATDTANITYHVNATALASGSTITISLGAVNDTGAVASAVFGAASGSYCGLDGADVIELGLGAMTVDGGLGADTITFGNTAVNKVQMTVNTVAGQDTVLGAAAGDMILFQGANTATANNYLTAAWVTGTAYDTAQIADASLTAFVTTAAGLSGHTAVRQLAIYTAAGDTIIEVLDGSAGHTGISGANITTADFVRIVLSNKDFTAITAAFQINSTGSGLSVTLL